MFDDFREFTVRVDDVEIFGLRGGTGRPLLLLHGYPQTHVMWHKVAPALAEHFTVVAADLRGYGRSSKPAPVTGHLNYSKRVMAADMIEVMRQFGFDGFSVMAHDRGARVAHRMAMDAPHSVERMMLLDIAPTREMYAQTNQSFARAYWHWFFLIQPAPLPERLIEADPRGYWLRKCGSGSAGLTPFTPAALDAYLTAFDAPEAIAASCEDYRAAATVDIEHDDLDGGRKVTCPVRVLWGAQGVIESHFDCLELWRERAEVVDGRALPGGHYLAEERPGEVVDEALDFFGRTR